METNAKPALRLASWNIRAGLGTDLRRDPGRVLDGIAALGADVVVLQEADFRMGARPSALPRDRSSSARGWSRCPSGRTRSASAGTATRSCAAGYVQRDVSGRASVPPYARLEDWVAAMPQELRR
jgi:hypothetical protein